jgi:dihydropyrimidinase
MGVPSGRVSIERLVDLLATTPARLFGMPTKGAIEPGRDADLVLFDPAARRTIRQAQLHHTSDFTPDEGLEVEGAIRQVLSRGRVVVRDGEWLGHRGHGRYVARGLD